MSTKLEVRRGDRGIELREDKPSDGSIGTIRGYAARFNSPSLDMGFIEYIAPGAFGKSLANGDDVRALGHHASQQVIGRRSAKTLRLSEDDKGLAVEIDLPDTTFGRDLLTLIRRGDLDGMSFGFEVVAHKWTTETHKGVKVDRRDLLEVNLFEVSVVTWPAYPETEVTARSISDILATREKQGPTEAERVMEWCKRMRGEHPKRTK